MPSAQVLWPPPEQGIIYRGWDSVRQLWEFNAQLKLNFNKHWVPNSLRLFSNSSFILFIYFFLKMVVRKGQSNLSLQQVKAKDQHVLTGCVRGFIIELFTAFISPVVADVFRIKELRSHFSSRDPWPGNKTLESYLLPHRLLDSYATNCWDFFWTATRLLKFILTRVATLSLNNTASTANQY